MHCTAGYFDFVLVPPNAISEPMTKKQRSHSADMLSKHPGLAWLRSI